MITTNDLEALVSAASYTGFEVNINDLELVTVNAGTDHIPTRLPEGFAAIYIFRYFEEYLKVGKVNPNSNARYQSQHYNPNSSRSNLSRSILSDIELNSLLQGQEPGAWLKRNTERFNILIPARLGKKFVHFAEAFFILRCNPRFEDTRA